MNRELWKVIIRKGGWYVFLMILILLVLYIILLPNSLDPYLERREVARLYSDTLNLRLKIDEKIELKGQVNSININDYFNTKETTYFNISKNGEIKIKTPILSKFVIFTREQFNTKIDWRCSGLLETDLPSECK